MKKIAIVIIGLVLMVSCKKNGTKPFVIISKANHTVIEGEITQFSIPNKYGNTGLLAHNYLSGRHFFGLGIGDVVQLVYGDREIKEYQIADIQRYQALQPDSPSSQFLDLNTGEKLSATQLFKRVYMGNHHLTLQTCIQEGLEDSWGRLFIIAKPN